MSYKSSNAEKLWETVFETLDVGEKLKKHGYFSIKASEIRERFEKEPRLMTKFDESKALPRILGDNDCAPLSVSRGSYILLRPHHLLFHKLEERPPKPTFISLGEWDEKISTIPWRGMTAESQPLDLLFLTGHLRSFLQEEELYLTVRGRRRFPKGFTQALKFQTESGVLDLRQRISDVQIEVDGGYESPSTLYIVEAKIGVPGDFNARQLYFPHLFWRHHFDRRETEKEIQGIFLYHNQKDSIYLYQYEVLDKAVFNSFSLIRSGWFVVGVPELSLKRIKNILESARETRNLKAIPFPQADMVTKVFDVVEQVSYVKEQAKSALIADSFKFTVRQGEYYANAASWLGWLEREPRGGWKTTKSGKKVAQSTFEERLILLIEALAERPVGREMLRELVSKKTVPDQETIESFITENRAKGLIREIKGTTIGRRAQTMKKWFEYIAEFVTDLT